MGRPALWIRRMRHTRSLWGTHVGHILGQELSHRGDNGLVIRRIDTAFLHSRNETLRGLQTRRGGYTLATLILKEICVPLPGWMYIRESNLL